MLLFVSLYQETQCTCPCLDLRINESQPKENEKEAASAVRGVDGVQPLPISEA